MTPDLMTVKQLAEYLQVHENFIYERTNERHPEHIPTTRFSSRCIRFRKDKVDKWLLRNTA